MRRLASPIGERDVRLRRGDELEVLLGGQRAERELHRVYDVLDRVLPQSELHTPRLDLGEVEDVVDQAKELRAAGPNVGDRLAQLRREFAVDVIEDHLR